MRVWRCRSADVKVWRSRSADVKVWRCSITAAFLRRTLRRRSLGKNSRYSKVLYTLTLMCGWKWCTPKSYSSSVHQFIFLKWLGGYCILSHIFAVFPTIWCDIWKRSSSCKWIYIYTALHTTIPDHSCRDCRGDIPTCGFQNHGVIPICGGWCGCWCIWCRGRMALGQCWGGPWESHVKMHRNGPIVPVWNLNLFEICGGLFGNFCDL